MAAYGDGDFLCSLGAGRVVLAAVRDIGADITIERLGTIMISGSRGAGEDESHSFIDQSIEARVRAALLARRFLFSKGSSARTFCSLRIVFFVRAVAPPYSVGMAGSRIPVAILGRAALWPGMASFIHRLFYRRQHEARAIGVAKLWTVRELWRSRWCGPA